MYCCLISIPVISFVPPSDADFVSSFHYVDNFVYFFLRETAVETGKVS